MKEVQGDLIKLAKESQFDVISHGCNCFCTMGGGIAPQMADAFACDHFPMEKQGRGDINKLGTIDYETFWSGDMEKKNLTVVNSYTQFHYGRNHKDGVTTPVDYDAITMCMRKINHIFKGKSIGLPKIGAGLAGGDWNKISKIIETELSDMDVWIVNYKQ